MSRPLPFLSFICLLPTTPRKPPQNPRTIRCYSPQPLAMEHQPPNRIVIIGGGVIGVCTAYFLAKRLSSSSSCHVTLIEQSSAVATAASGKAGGFLALDWCDGGPVQDLARASFALHRSLAEELDGAQSYGYRPLTTLSLPITELDSDHQKIVSSSSPSPSPSPGKPDDLPAWVNGPGRPRRARTIGTTQDTAQVHPQLFTRKLLDKAVGDFGLEVVVGRRVDAVHVDGNGTVRSVGLEGGEGGVVEMEADAVVLAIGPWSGKFGLLKRVFGVYGLKAHSIVLEPREKDEITPHALFLSFSPREGGPALDPEVYPRPTGEVYICGMSAREDVPDHPDEASPNGESINMLKRVAKAVSTHLAEGEAQVKAEQACFLPCTDDGVPVIGQLPGAQGCYVATGHSCWGILNGPATGAAMAELVLDGQAQIVDLDAFSPSRFVAFQKRR